MVRYNYRFFIILIPKGRFYCYTSWNTRRVFAKLNLGILKKDRKTIGVRYNYRFIIILIHDGRFYCYASWVSSCLWFRNTRRVFAKTQSRYSLLGLKPTGNLALQMLKEKTKNPILATRLPPTAGAQKRGSPRL